LQKRGDGLSRSDILLLTVTAIALIFSFPPFLGGAIAMIALIPYIHFIGNKSNTHAFLGGYAIGLVWTSGTVYWIGWATLTGLIGTIIYVPVFVALLTLTMNWIIKSWGRKAVWLLPLFWTSMEFIQTQGPLAFPWNQLANTQTHMITFIQFASLFGSIGVGFWLVLLNVAFYWLFRLFGKNLKTVLVFGFICLLLGIPALHGSVALKRDYDKRLIGVSLIQGNIDPYKKWTPAFVDSSFLIYRRLSLSQNRFNHELIIWPETAIPCYLRYRYRYLSQIRALADSLNTPILTGSPDYEWDENGEAIVYNAALMIEPNQQSIQKYYKIHLVPFSEQVPLVDQLPFFYSFLSSLRLDVGHYATGDSIHIFKTHDHCPFAYGVAICFDSVFSSHIKNLVKKGAQFIVIITNDGWFGHTSGPYQHAQIAVLRAIESGRWIARCANTGISSVIDPCGRIQIYSHFGREQTLHHPVGIRDSQTAFNRFGHRLPLFILLLSVCILGFSMLTHANRNR
jgi:apolipoprotein N-acyltransferase